MTPLDLIPDFLPVVGFADDAAVLTSVIAFIKNKLNETKTSRAQ